ncbi:hypothetical protein I4U23_001187 [Adineta vaga]|nr:hypothetical protein I4U23_001187 [Adineta vaga]
MVNFWDLFFHGALPPLIITLFNIFLLIRVIYQKHIHLQQPIVWRKHRRMTIQVVSVSFLYLLICFPTMIITLCKFFGISTFIGDEILKYTYFFTYFIGFLLPYVCLATLPELRLKLKNIFIYSWLCKNPNRVQPFHDPTFATRRRQTVNHAW